MRLASPLVMTPWLLVLVLGSGFALSGEAARSRVQAPIRVCPLAELPGLYGHWQRALRESRAEHAPGGRGGARIDPARAADLSRVAHAVIGSSGDLLVADLAARVDVGVGVPTPPLVACAPVVRDRDAVAWRMSLAGFSARETADVVGGHLQVDDVLQARARLMAGQAEAIVAAFLEARWNAAQPADDWLPPAPMTVARRAGVPTLAAFEPELVALARRHDVAPDLVRAVIAAESGGNVRAVSPAGAIGLMQLMPGTAAALGVNPREPLDNLRGGIAYLASLLREFDADTRLALIAYNAGPQHARDVRAGRAVAYRETRAYLEAIGARFPFAR